MYSQTWIAEGARPHQPLRHQDRVDETTLERSPGNGLADGVSHPRFTRMVTLSGARGCTAFTRRTEGA